MLHEKQDRFSSDRGEADRSLKIWLEHSLANIPHLLKLRRGARHVTALHSFEAMIRAGEEFTPGQKGYLEKIYELTFEGAGFESCKTHIDRKRKGLRFG